MAKIASKELRKVFRTCVKRLGEEFTTKDKQMENVFKRAIYYNIAKELTTDSLAAIGKLVGRDHSTVYYWLDDVRFERDISGVWRRIYDELFHECYLSVPQKEYEEIIAEIDKLKKELWKLQSEAKSLLESQEKGTELLEPEALVSP